MENFANQGAILYSMYSDAVASVLSGLNTQYNESDSSLIALTRSKLIIDNSNIYNNYVDYGLMLTESTVTVTDTSIEDCGALKALKSSHLKLIGSTVFNVTVDVS